MQRRTVVRYFLDGVGVILALIGLSGIGGSVWFLTVGLFALFLGVTNFGRQCPLILSARHVAYRIRSRRKPMILSAKSVEEINERDH